MSTKELFRESEIGKHKTCRDCKILKPVSEFYQARGKHGRSQNPMSYCKPCYNTRTRRYYDRRYAADPSYRELLKECTRKGMLAKKYGMSLEEYDAKLEAQDGKCAICKTGESHKRNGKVCKFAVDHDHITGKVRGLLCTRCNTTVGRIESDLYPVILAYLEKYKEDQDG